MAKRKLEVFQTPVGTLLWPWINDPDTRYHKDGGIFQAKISLDFEDPETQSLIAQAERVRDAHFAGLDPQKCGDYRKKDVYELEYTMPDKDATDEEKKEFVPEPTGNILIKAKLHKIVRPQNKDPFEQRVIIVDKDEAPLEEQVWMGTKARLKGQLYPWDAGMQRLVGVTFRLRSVQVIDLVTGTGSQWGSFGDTPNDVE